MDIWNRTEAASCRPAADLDGYHHQGPVPLNSSLNVGGWTAGSRLREARGREEERLEVTRANL
jgi:hypothetical protein